MVESIMNKFKFSYFDVPRDQVQRRVLSHLAEKIHMYENKDKGKAFSYFTVVVKNKLIQINNKNYDRYKEEIRIDDDNNHFDLPMERNFQEELETDQFFGQMIKHWEDNMSNMFSKKRDIKIADALIELFKKRKRIETFNKKALYVMIRERSGVERTQHITKVVKKFKEQYYKMAKNYYNTGSIKPNQKFFEQS
jgi:hypothetical protein